LYVKIHHFNIYFYCEFSKNIRLDEQVSRIPFLAGAGNFSLHHRVQNGSGAHPASYPVGTRGSFPAVKPSGREADHSLPSTSKVKECVELYLHSPYTPSWHDAQSMSHRRENAFQRMPVHGNYQ
jgi:hypothetical protein